MSARASGWHRQRGSAASRRALPALLTLGLCLRAAAAAGQAAPPVQPAQEAQAVQADRPAQALQPVDPTALPAGLQEPSPLLETDAEGFLIAAPGRPLELPRDHGSHPRTRLEWWYLSGPLQGPSGERFGFQATWFRRALLAELPPGRSPLAARELILFHGALTDLDAGTFVFTDTASRAYPAWAGASTGRLDVWLFEQRLVDAEGAGRRAELTVALPDARLELQLELQASEVLLHGSEPGLSRKGRRPGQASWYYSLPTVAVGGRLLRPDQQPLPVRGRVWLDHEFGAGPLAEGLVGWDWFATVLDDGCELMAYRLRGDDGATSPSSSATLRRADGERLQLPAAALRIVAVGSWGSPHSGIEYPAGWLLTIPDQRLTLRVTPLLADQELITESAGVSYWEGLCRFEGEHAGRPVHGDGYVELVGYGASIADRFAATGTTDTQLTKR